MALESLQESTVTDSSVFKHSIFGCSKQREQWNDKVLVETDPVPFKVDTGAEVTALIIRRYI